ncbi:MAG: division/cell wall cluster transcriptional repressor MraZ [Legionellales bacterium]|nr:division/cell wall cluster transcriptional repressor MraZ [Legionellales bacterium]
MFRGINAIHIDGKGRLAIPTRYRDVLGAEADNNLVLTIDTEETCLLLYPLKQWQVIEEKIQRLPSFDPVARRIQRLLIGHATDVALDGAGRLLLPQVLRDYAQLEKRVLMIGQGAKFELWSEQLWEARRDHWLREESTRLGQLPDELKTFYL